MSGPTVVLPLLKFIRPTERLQHVLAWEGSLIDPVGGMLGAVVYAAVLAGGHTGLFSILGQFLASVAVGLAGAAVGIALLWLLLHKLQLGDLLGTTAQLACVIGVAAACDVVRDDAGLLAAVFMGLALANAERLGFRIPSGRPFFETLVQLIIGVLFVSISATVAPSSLSHLVLPALGLVLVLVLVTRPLVALLTTWRSNLSRGERLFTGWMAPRGIVAAATASTFSAGLAANHVGGADKILPATFLVIVATVAIYGLTAVPVARRVGVSSPARTRPLLIGGDEWVVALGRVLDQAGVDVRMWARPDKQREDIKQAGLTLASGEFLQTATGKGAESEGVTMVLLLTGQDDFESLASDVLRGGTAGGVYRLASSGGSTAASRAGREILFDPALTWPEVVRRFDAGSRVSALPADSGVPAGHDLLFLLRADGGLVPATGTTTPTAREGDTMILLGCTNECRDGPAAPRLPPRSAMSWRDRGPTRLIRSSPEDVSQVANKLLNLRETAGSSPERRSGGSPGMPLNSRTCPDGFPAARGLAANAVPTPHQW